MKFIVKFICKNIYELPLSVGKRPHGTRDIERVRAELNIPNLDPARIAEMTPEIGENPSIEVPYNMVVRCSHFEDTNCVTVIVDRCALNQFVREDLTVERSRETGEVNYVRFRPYVDTYQVLQWWEQNEFKLDLSTKI